MVLSALAVVYINTDETVAEGEEQMAQAYQMWKIDDSSSSIGMTIAMSLANGLVMVSVICLMTFCIVLLYKFECMKCLIGYMMLCSTTLLGFLGGHMYWVAIQIYSLPVDKLSYFLGLWNFAVVGVVAIFMGQGVPKFVTQGYLIATSVIMSWHLDYFDEYTTWALLFMLAMYDLCAVLTPCGPLKALVNLMSRDDAPEMPGLLYEADLPPEARRPGAARNNRSRQPEQSSIQQASDEPQSSDPGSGVWDNRSSDSAPRTEVPLAVARVYNLPVLGIPPHSQGILGNSSSSGNVPLLDDADDEYRMPESPTPTQLMAEVLVRLPKHGGRIEKVRRNGKTMYLERDRFGNPKRVLWVDKEGRVFAESSDGEDGDDRNTIRLGLGDFIFYSVLVAKAAQYSFTTFAACMLVILAGLGGTLVLLAVFHHALPALPISICLGIFFYIVTRIFMEPYVEAVLLKPYYV
jgi:presenilin 1